MSAQLKAQFKAKYGQSNNYRPSLPDLMGLCAANYMLLLKLMADKEVVGEVREFTLAEQSQYQLVVKEVTKYTSLVEFSEQSTSASSHHIARPTMVIRLYHDAKMAEVISSQSVRQIKPRYDYPNDAMHHPDEKLQINLFLKEWLQLCLSLGQTPVSLKLND